MTTPYQPLTISYGAFSISDSNKASYTLNELDWGADYSRLKGVVTFNVMVKGDTDAEVISRSNSLEEAYRGRRDTLTISVNGETYRTYSSTNKEVISTIRLLRDDTFTSKTRLYEVQIEADLDPPDNEKRTIQGVTLTYAPSRVRTMQIVIDYHSTGGGVVSAKSNYESDTAIWGTLLGAWAGGSTKWWLPEESIDGDIDLNSKLTVTRTYTEKIKKAEVDYGGFSVGGSSTAYDLVDGWNFRAGRLEANVSFVVRVSGTSDGDLASKSNDLEEAFRKRQQTLELKYDGATQRDFSGDNIYLNSSATATALDNPWFGTNSPATTTGETFAHTRDYRIDITIDMPPAESPDGRTEQDVSIEEDASGILTVTISAQYNSIEGSEAKELMELDFEDYTELVRTRTGITLWKQLKSSTDEIPIDQSGTLTGVEIKKTATFRELSFAAASGIGAITSDANIKDFKLDFSISKKFPGDTTSYLVSDELSTTRVLSGSRSELYENLAGRLKDINVLFSYNYIKGAATSIESYYQNTVRPLIVLYFQEKILNTADTVIFAIVDENVKYNEANERTVSGTMQIQASNSLSLYGSITGETSEDFGKIITNIYDGNPHSKVSQQGEAERRRTIRGTVTLVEDPFMSLPAIAPSPPLPGGTGWETISYNESQHPIVFGDPYNEEESFSVKEISFSEVQIWIEAPITLPPTPNNPFGAI